MRKFEAENLYLNEYNKLASNVLEDRKRLIVEITDLATKAIYGTLSETYRTCGNPNCRCHHGGPKHGPHLYISYRGDTGKTTGYYVPQAAADGIRAGVKAWSDLQEALRKLASLNKEIFVPKKGEKKRKI